MHQFKIVEFQDEARVEMEKLDVVATCRISADWDKKIGEIAQQSGRKKAEILREAIAAYLGESQPTVKSDLEKLKDCLLAVQEQNKSLLVQNCNLHKRLQQLEGKFKAFATA